MELLETADGSLTLRHEVLGELYHSDRGAVGEAEHVYIRAGLDRALKERTAVSVFEVGFGTGLNGWLTCLRAQETGVKIDYRAVDLYPVGMATVRQLNYTSDPVFTTLHDLPWDGLPHTVSEYFTLTKYEADLLSFDFVSLKGVSMSFISMLSLPTCSRSYGRKRLCAGCTRYSGRAVR